MQGGTSGNAYHRIAVTEQTCYHWRKKYGGLKTDQARRMKDLKKGSLRLGRAISDLTLDKLILRRLPEEASEPRVCQPAILRLKISMMTQSIETEYK